MCSKLTIKILERRRLRSGIFIVNFEHVIAGRPKPSKLLVFSRFLRLKVSQWLLSSLTKYTNFKCIPVIFQHSSLTYGIPLLKNQNSFDETGSLTMCMLNIKAFNRINRKQLKILKTYLEYLNFILLLTKDHSTL